MIALLPGPAFGQLGKIFDQILKPKGPSDNRVVEGLKEALRIGTENAVKETGRVDGFFANTLIKILMPEKLRALEKTMRVIGMGKQVDAFILSMNRAAETAAPLAKDIFVGAVKEMTFDDARKILTGGETAATSFFQTKTTDRLAAAFRPVIQKSMADNQVGRNFQNVLNATKKIPFAKTDSIDIESYVLGKSLAGLFYVIGQEERKIRKDPAARVTSILKEVFT
jgi:hypothetical protein